MSTGKYYEGALTVGHTQSYDKCVTISSVFCYNLRTTDQHIAALESDIVRMQQQIADQGMMIAQLREVVQGEPPFLQPAEDWHLGE